MRRSLNSGRRSPCPFLDTRNRAPLSLIIAPSETFVSVRIVSGHASAGLRGTSAGGAEVPVHRDMFIEIQDLELHPIDFREEFGPGMIDLGADVRQRSPLLSEGRAELVEERHGKHEVVRDIRLKGRLKTDLEVACARCLEPVAIPVERRFDLLYRPLGTDAGHEELSVTDAEAEIGYYQGEGLQLEDTLREQVLLAVPLKSLCREDCRGLCPHCGKNLNETACSCADQVEDPRWAALKEIRSKLE